MLKTFLKVKSANILLKRIFIKVTLSIKVSFINYIVFYYDKRLRMSFLIDNFDLKYVCTYILFTIVLLRKSLKHFMCSAIRNKFRTVGSERNEWNDKRVTCVTHRKRGNVDAIEKTNGYVEKRAVMVESTYFLFFLVFSDLQLTLIIFYFSHRPPR